MEVIKGSNEKNSFCGKFDIGVAPVCNADASPEVVPNT
jgi:hypothetical protein